jgi:hypothetical protein
MKYLFFLLFCLFLFLDFNLGPTTKITSPGFGFSRAATILNTFLTDGYGVHFSFLMVPSFSADAMYQTFFKHCEKYKNCLAISELVAGKKKRK